MIKLLKVQEAVEILKNNGIPKMNAVRLRMGIEQGVYPFGTVVSMEGRPVYDIYSTLLEKWIAERSEGVDERKEKTISERS